MPRTCPGTRLRAQRRPMPPRRRPRTRSCCRCSPASRRLIEAKYQDSLSQIGGGAHVRQGIRVGTDAANAILAARANDGSGATPPPFTPQAGPGEYQLTPPSFQQPVFTHWAAVRPFALRAG